MKSDNRVTSVGDTVKIGNVEYKFATPGSRLQRLEDANHLLGDSAALKAELEDKGYLFIRGLHDRDEVLEARRAVLKYLHDLGDKLDESRPWEEGVLLRDCGATCVPFMEGSDPLANHSPSQSAAVMKVIEGPRPKKFFSDFFGEPCLTFNYKWLRAMYDGGFTGAHTDSVYMSRGTPNLVTMWTPIGDVDTGMGTIAVVEKSHRNDEFQQLRDTYSNMDAEAENLDGTGWFTSDPDEIINRFGGEWKTTDFKAGDVLLFTMKTVHMSTTNTSGLARVSCDTRWQSASEKVDPRYSGSRTVGHVEAKFGTHAEDKDISDDTNKKVTMAQKKAEWGFS